MNCEQMLRLMSAYLDGEDCSGDEEKLAAHLAECPDCQATSELYRRQNADLREAFAAHRTSAAAVAERVVQQLRVEPPITSREPQRVVATTGRLRSRLVLVSLLSAAAGFLLAVVLFRPWDRPSPRGQEFDAKANVHLALATGAVEFQCPGEEDWQPLATGGHITNGTTVRTPAGVRCEFVTADGSEVRLNGGTKVCFQTHRKLDLANGQAWSNVAKANVPFEVTVPDAKVTALGTQFDLQCRPAETVLTVLEGTTRVQGKEGSRIVKQGQAAKIIGGSVTPPREAEDLVLVTKWVHELLLLKGRDNKELNRRIDDLLAQIGATKSENLYENEIRSLGDHCVLPLTRFLQSERSQGSRRKDQRQQAARILADLAEPWSVGDLIGLLRDRDQDVRFYAATGLLRLTKETHGLEPKEWRGRDEAKLETARKAWEQWWEANKDRYRRVP